MEVVGAFLISSPSGNFQERATLTFYFSPIFDEFGLLNLGVYTVSANGALTRLPASINRSSHTATFPVGGSGGIYLMAYDRPGMNDVTPPKTTVHFSPTYTKTKFGIILTTATRISLSGEDYSTMTVVAAGYDQALYWIDVPADDINNTIPNEYSSPFTLTLGTHTLTYFGRDKNGNYEAPTRLNLDVRDPRK
jgi:hypothetical protein